MLKETHAFQSESKQLLQLFIHSLYSNKEIFLRELISNASDAIDKRHLSSQDMDFEPCIQIVINEAEQTLSVVDNGIGMSKAEVIKNLGTIAHSDTKAFIEKSKEKELSPELIGQFGVGFYASFMVANKVVVHSMNGQEGTAWESQGAEDYLTYETSKKNQGTEVVLYLKEEEKEFLDEERLKSIIKKHSDHMNIPIMLKGKAEDFEVVNQTTALWTLPKSQVTPEAYVDFYKSLNTTDQEPLHWIHHHVEGKYAYKLLLYIPQATPAYLKWQANKQKFGMRLYVNKVLISDRLDVFLPSYLRFVVGVVDSADLPLNISREILQDNRIIEVIRATATRHILDALVQMAEKDKEKYQQFWNEFSFYMKEGVIEDHKDRQVLSELLRFSSSIHEDYQQDVSLADYCQRMKEGQAHIYYITAENFQNAKNSPYVEGLIQNGTEVLYLIDRVDEWLVSHLPAFQGKTLKSVVKENIDLKTDKKESLPDEFIQKVQVVLGARVKKVNISQRLTSSPACIVYEENDMGANLSRILQSSGYETPKGVPILEINPHHHLVQTMQSEKDEDKFNAFSFLLFEQSVLLEDGRIDNPKEFIERVNQLLVDKNASKLILQ